MSALDKAAETQLTNIESKTGKAREALMSDILAEGLSKHGEMVKWAKENWGIGHGDANLVVHLARKQAEGGDAPAGDPLDEIYSGAKAHQRPIHEQLMNHINEFGAFEVSPKKGYVSLRRKKQFAMLGPKTKDRFELGLNLKEEISHPLVKAVPPGGMCQYIVSIHSPDEIDDQLIDFTRKAFDAAG